jgi:hypothetical protein
MGQYIFITIFVAVWLGGVLSQFLIRKRMKELYPILHSELFASSLAEHNIASSLKYMSFSMKSSKWGDIDDQLLITYLKMQNALFVVMVVMMLGFLAACFRNALSGY